jgi:hypothetical protein
MMGATDRQKDLDAMIYSELKEPSTQRSIPAEQMLREEAVEVWEQYKTMAGRFQY